MHCHVSRHISAGLGMQYLEAPSQIVLPDQGVFNEECEKWRAYTATAVYPKTDSGL